MSAAQARVGKAQDAQIAPAAPSQCPWAPAHLVQALYGGVLDGLGLVKAVNGVAPPLHPHRHHQLLLHLKLSHSMS